MGAVKRPMLDSLRARLVVALLTVGVLGAVAIAVLAETDRLSASDALEDTSLPTQARDVIRKMRFDRDGRLQHLSVPMRWRQAYSVPGGAYYTVFDPVGRAIQSSQNLARPLARLDLLPGRSHSALQIVGTAQDLVLTVGAPYGYELTVGRSNPGVLHEADPDPWFDFLPLVVLLGVILISVVLVWGLAEWMLSSIRRASKEASAIGPNSTGARLSIDGLPAEVRPLAQAVNGALDRVQAGYDAEKRFTANAAHALRTPLAVIDLRLQRAASTGEVDVGGLRHDLKDIARLVAGLLNLAHAEHRRSAGPLNLARLLREEAARLQPLLHDRGRDIAVEAPDTVTVQGDTRALRDMIGALLENALTHGAGQVTASLDTEAEDASAVLRIADEGAGVPSADWELVFERFRKRDASSPGAGLGLAIVREVAEAAGGEAAFVGPAAVCVRLPLLDRSAGG
ncbi:MAG TPA: HAMP domain-containing sensor histidine kinase [Caulobacteraceae bacterium]|nr:HAMP domain-containing sensor histidine kinase [Caulobacteraceae bacterium]